MTLSAKDIYQDLLDRSAQATLSGDVAVLLSDFVNLPIRHTCSDQSVFIETPNDFADGWMSFSQSLTSRGVNRFIRQATDAEFLSENYIEGHHITHTLRDSTPVLDSYANRMVLRRVGGMWKVTEVESTVVGDRWPLEITQLPDDPLARCEGVKKDARRYSSEPLALYQRFLNELTRTNLSGTFEEYCAMIRFPFTLHSDVHDVFVTSPQEMRPFYDMLLNLMVQKKYDQFLRIADRAEFIAGDQLCGYHTSWFFRGDGDGLDPIKSRILLRRCNGRWLIESATNGIANDQFPYNSPIPGDLVTQREIQERTKTWPNLH